MSGAAQHEGLLERPDGARIWWERWGGGPVPALFLHGGPGSGLSEHHRAYFDPEVNTVVGLDQRGCARSTPSAADDLEALGRNTTQTLLADIEALRDQQGVDSWLVVGLSWGATLALAYAEAHPDRVSGLVLGAVTTTSRSEVEWITQDLRHVFPREWEQLREAADPAEGERVVDALYRRITGPDPSAREAAAIAWGAWENTHGSLDPGFAPDPRWQDPHKRREVATLVLHYWSHSAFLGDAGILDRADRLAGIPGVLVHGRRDLSSSLSVPYDLQRSWPEAELIVVDDEGHYGPAIFAAVRRGVSRLSALRVR
ncbi:alpha/beta fold hydrolase [Naasia aerilata]|uniref:Proline iminopeptidase n=1 Tax=Naasia aerilata TaxID=1162966 RepID=A0ABN6XR05_9MICO|nr:alpha/beta fold hydrolase [Naasia aerilata]BDZ47301.1 proline iminopeptidase [Naasia aerilata]